ncbi:MAG: hypothetical protein NCW75_00630 [Phycisphaera sp.]|nr:MAG: hypothetical protein NCW75_00630 [Phycisphaera sp.]
MSQANVDECRQARSRMLANLAGVLVCEAGAEPCRLVAAERGGSVTLPMHRDLDEAGQWSFAAPQELDPAIELCLEPVDGSQGDLPEPDEIEADRWLAYHGSTPPKCRLVSLAISFARYAGGDGRTRVAEEVLTPNPLRSAVPALCKLLNSDKARLAEACARLTGVRPESPVAVGVDDSGVHVKAAFDVLRLGFDEPAMDEAAARAAIGEVLDG